MPSKWAPDTDLYRSYQREYQKKHYVSTSRREGKQVYYVENRERILGKQAYTRVAQVFRTILL